MIFRQHNHENRTSPLIHKKDISSSVLSILALYR